MTELTEAVAHPGEPCKQSHLSDDTGRCVQKTHPDSLCDSIELKLKEDMHV